MNAIIGASSAKAASAKSRRIAAQMISVCSNERAGTLTTLALPARSPNAKENAKFTGTLAGAM
jgi:hypothetical protein